MQTIIAKESKVFEQDYQVFEDNGQLKAVFGSEAEADGFIYISVAVPIICEKMQHFKQNSTDTADTVLTICNDFKAVSKYGNFNELERLTAKPVLNY